MVLGLVFPALPPYGLGLGFLGGGPSYGGTGGRRPRERKGVCATRPGGLVSEQFKFP